MIHHELHYVVDLTLHWQNAKKKCAYPKTMNILQLQFKRDTMIEQKASGQSKLHSKTNGCISKMKNN